MKILPDDTIRLRWRVGDRGRTFVSYVLPEGKTLEVFDDEALPCNVVRLREIHIGANGRAFALELQGVTRTIFAAYIARRLFGCEVVIRYEV